MITRLYIDNYKSFVNFECPLGSQQLLMGANGSGKSSLIDVLHRVRRLVADGENVLTAFPNKTLTRWQNRKNQTFEIDLAGNGGKYAYRLVIEQNADISDNRIVEESLAFEARPLYRMEKGDAQLFDEGGRGGGKFPIDWTRSGLAVIQSRKGNERLSWFRDRMARVYCAQINPFAMHSRSEGDLRFPDQQLSGFASWFRHLVQEKTEVIHGIFKSLQEPLDGFRALRLGGESDNLRTLKAVFDCDPNDEGAPVTQEFDFGDLSEGQKCLIVLYTLLHEAVAQDSTLCIDEPDNFVQLSEIEPWLFETRDATEENGAQTLLASHHPELINAMAKDAGLLLARDINGPTRLQRFEPDAGSELPPSEIIARGWGDGQTKRSLCTDIRRHETRQVRQ